MTTPSKRVYVSYSWATEDKTKIIEKLSPLCVERNIELIFDRKVIKHGELISEFMDEIANGEHIIVVFSQNYLESEYCMYELLKIYQHDNFHKRVHPVIADDIVLSTIEAQMNIIEFWKELARKTMILLKGHSGTTVLPLKNRLKKFEDIHREVNVLMDFAGNMLVTPLDDLIKQNFEQVLNCINPISDVVIDKPDFPSFQEDPIYIEEEIEDLLKNANELRTYLIPKLDLNKESNANDLVVELKKQAESDPTQPIRYITNCTIDQLDQIDSKDVSLKTKKLIKESEKLVCLVSMFDIHAKAAEQLKTFPIDMVLSQEAPGTAETLFARKFQSNPKYRISNNSPDIVGKHAIISDEIEAGIKSNPIVDEIEKVVWNRVFPNFSSKKFDRKRLRSQIRIELNAVDRNKKNFYYLFLNKQNEKDYLQFSEVKKELKSRLPELPVITLKYIPNSMVCVSSDSDLMAAIFNFYDQINPYLPQAQKNE